MAKRTTLIDIAQAVGVTPSTVQRALSGTAGVSEEKRREIKKVAEQMGYKSNVMARMLQKQGFSIAVVLPEPTYYSQRLWDGVERFLAENTGFNIVCHRYTYSRSPEGFAAALASVWDAHGQKLDGLLTMGEPGEEFRRLYRRWLACKIPVVWVGTEGDPADRVCCCRSVDEMAGQIAADLLLLSACPPAPMKVILTGDFSISDQFADMQGFERVLLKSNPVCEIIKLSGKIPDTQMQQLLCSRLQSEQNITAIFSTSARNTVNMCQAVEQAGLAGQLRLIGSDLFPQSRELLLQGRLNAIIDKRPSWQAYHAAQALVSCILGEPGQAVTSTIYCSPTVITRSNVDCANEI